MKGLKIEKAKASNSIDVYALLKSAAEEGVLEGRPTERQLKAYYFGRLLNELVDPRHIFLLAKRGRGYLGSVHAIAIPGRWDGAYTKVIVDSIFVVKHRRKNGVGRKLVDELVKQVQNMGITKVEFACPLDQAEYWKKERKAEPKMAVMGVEL